LRPGGARRGAPLEVLPRHQQALRPRREDPRGVARPLPQIGGRVLPRQQPRQHGLHVRAPLVRRRPGGARLLPDAADAATAARRLALHALRPARAGGRVTSKLYIQPIARRTNMKRNLDGKRALVTGASSGIGKALAIALGKAGVKLALSARRQDALDKLANE